MTLHKTVHIGYVHDVEYQHYQTRWVDRLFLRHFVTMFSNSEKKTAWLSVIINTCQRKIKKQGVPYKWCFLVQCANPNPRWASNFTYCIRVPLHNMIHQQIICEISKICKVRFHHWGSVLQTLFMNLLIVTQ